MNSSIARLLLVAQNGEGAGSGKQLCDDYSSNYNYNHNNYDHNVAQSSLQLQGWEFSQPTNDNYTTPSLSYNSRNEDVLSELPNLASLTSHTSFQNPSSSGGGSTSSSSSANTCSLLYGNPTGSYFFDDILGPVVKRQHHSEHALAAFVPIAALSPSCQALGCKSDLRFSKHYHRRHKVCELHSKAASVVINGNPQRFCQQCSRFHLLSEFDDGKRSCRKRLADHNRRRRKPQAINSNTTTVVVATSSNSTSNDSSTNTTSSNTTTTTTTNTTTDTIRTMSIAFRNNTTSSKSNHINDHLGQENKEKKGQSKEQIIHINYSSNSKSIGSVLSLSGNQVDLQSIPLQLHSPNVLSNTTTTNNNNNVFFATTLQNHQKHHVEEKPHHHHIVEEEEEEDKKELLSEDYYFFSKSSNNSGNFEGLF